MSAWVMGSCQYFRVGPASPLRWVTGRWTERLAHQNAVGIIHDVYRTSQVKRVARCEGEIGLWWGLGGG